MGSKRGRLLMRQHRVKKEIDPSQITPEIEIPSPSHLLSVPHLRIERHSSEPAPGTSPPSPNLLSVPSSTYLTKQHSHPLLPSQSPPTLVMQRQMSHPLANPQASSTPLHIQFIATSLKSEHEAGGHRAMSPAVVIMGDQNSSIHETTSRIKNEDLRRSASSPQSFSPRELEVLEGTRSSHCPVVRPGPALGCNFCWNTIDNHGRILRRKTKYHCPECQTNLCIVPCFQEYHEKHQGQNDNSHNEMSGKGSLSSNILKQYPKTGSF